MLCFFYHRTDCYTKVNYNFILLLFYGCRHFLNTFLSLSNELCNFCADSPHVWVNNY